MTIISLFFNISSYKKQYFLKYTNNLFKIKEAFCSFLYSQVKVIKEKSFIKIIYRMLKSIKYGLL